MRRSTTLLAVLAVTIGQMPIPSQAQSTYDMIFPLVPDFPYGDNFGDPRSGGRSHAGIDISAPKMTPVLAVANGTVGWMQDELGGNCCALEIQHDDGYESWYIHLNNDTPGTDDGLGWGFAEGIHRGAQVFAGQLIGWVGDSGNAEATIPHLHFELHDPDGVALNPYEHLNAATRLDAPIAGGSFAGAFWDDDGSVHEENIDRLADLGVTGGCAPYQFCPDDSVTRAQMATFLMRALGLAESPDDAFDDDNGSTHEASINALVAAGISSGCTPDSFCGSDFVTREHMATFMARAFELPNSDEQPFGDVVENQHTWAIRALAAAGITSGCGNGDFCPNDPVTRAQMASFLIRAIDWE